jgi:Acetyltransferases, including N-acetylases of ribosomal proteins
MVELREITRDNFDDCISLKVSEKQKKFVAANTYSLAQAWAYYKTAFPFAIYNDNVLVGFIMLGYYESENCYTIWRFMIDERYQGKGYGKAALLLGVQYLVETHGAKEVFLSVVPGNTIAEGLYRSVGFERTGGMSGDEAVMCLKVTA